MIPKPRCESARVREDRNGDSGTFEEREQRQKRGKVIGWLDKYADKMDKYWSRLPNFAGSAMATCAIFLLAACFQGEWMLIFVHFARRYGYSGEQASAVVSSAAEGDGSNASHSINRGPRITPEETTPPYLRNFGIAWAAALTVSYTIYFSFGGFLHWYFYVRQRDKAEEWKCQPYKWLTPALERHEIMLGASSLFFANMITAAFATYLTHDFPCMVYYDYAEYTWLWWFLQWPVLYVILDYESYWIHRLYHWPKLYKMFHKLHHKYKQPTAWSTTAIHPVEIIHMQLCYLVPLFIIPTHLIPFCTIMMYNFYHGILDHSGINFKAQWWQPWQPDASFHDNHHQYTHVNFGFNMVLWDKLYGTYRLKDRIYNEDIFFGKGKKLSEATKEELEADFSERNSENTDNKEVYKLDKKILETTKIE